MSFPSSTDPGILKSEEPVFKVADGWPNKFPVRNQIGMTVFQNTNDVAGIWADITSSVLDSGAGSQDLFASTAVNNAVFFGFTDRFPAIEFLLAGIINLGGGSIEFQYWNGAWNTISIMETNSTSKTSNANVAFEDLSVPGSTTRIRHADNSDWVSTTLNGQNKYWIKCIITGVITASPIVDRIAILRDGFYDGELFGVASRQRIKDGLIDSFYDQIGKNSPNASFTVGPDTSITKINGAFAPNAFDGIGTVIGVPDNIDTSQVVALVVKYKGTTANTNNWESRTAISIVEEGDLGNGGIPQSLFVSQHLMNNEANIIKKFTEEFDLSAAFPVNELFIGISRDARAGNIDDLYTGQIRISSIRFLYKPWK